MVPRSLGVICYNDAFLERVTKITSRIGLMNSQPTFLLLIYFELNELWSYYQKDTKHMTF